LVGLKAEKTALINKTILLFKEVEIMLKKKGVSWFLILIISLSVIASGCSRGNDVPSDATPTPENSPTPIPDETPEPTPEDGGLPEADLGGYVFTVADANINRWFPEEGSSDLANAIIERIKWVQDKYNCKIEHKPHSEDAVNAAIMAGDKYADFFVTETWELARHIVSKHLVDMNTIPNLDLTADYWAHHNQSGQYTFFDKTFAAAAPFADQAEQIWFMVFNKAIINELGLENPYDLVKNNEWTFEKMYEMQLAAADDLNGDGVMDINDRYGLATGHDWDISVALYVASGNKIYDLKEDGTLEFSLNSPKAIEAINMIKKMVKKGESFFPKDDAEGMEAYVKAFTEGKVLFLAYSRGYGMLDPIYEMEDDFGIVPMPMGNNTDKYLNWISHNAPAVAVPVTNKDLDKAGLILQALAWKAQDESKILEDEYAYTKLRDDESMETIKNLWNYGEQDFGFFAQAMNWALSVHFLPMMCFYDQSQEPVSEIARMEQRINIALDDLEVMLQEAASAAENPAE
jgi:ABC-type glycerol-3-phosphate transport system substrate-binding protein